MWGPRLDAGACLFAVQSCLRHSSAASTDEAGCPLSGLDPDLLAGDLDGASQDSHSGSLLVPRRSYRPTRYC